jgi:hypothetical protein
MFAHGEKLLQAAVRVKQNDRFFFAFLLLMWATPVLKSAPALQ